MSTSGAGANNSELLHLEMKCGTVQSKTFCGASWTRKHPSGFLQDRTDMIAFDIRQGLGLFVAVPGCDAGTKIPKWYVQGGVGSQNHSSLDYILQFADVSRPTVLSQSLNRSRRDRINRFVHPLRSLLHEMTDEKRDIVCALTQRRNGNRENVQAVIEVTAKLLL